MNHTSDTGLTAVNGSYVSRPRQIKMKFLNPDRFPLLAYVISCSGLAVALLPSYPGSFGVFLAFSLCYFALIGLTAPRPRLYGYTFLSALLFLGFWLKVAVHSLWPVGFVDPVGDFGNTPQEWDTALIVASCGALGVIVPRLIHLFAARRRNSRHARPSYGSAPAWYRRRRRPVWAAALLLVVLVNAANLHFAFHQVGANTKLLLPLHLHVIAAWLVNVGFSLGIAVLIFWDTKIGAGSFARNLAAPIAEAACSSISSMSRLMYLLHAGPYFLAIYEKWSSLKTLLSRRRAAHLVVTFIAVFCLSILAVFWLRANDYYPYAENVPPGDSVEKHMERTIRSQLPQLFVHRWVGLEGVLAVGALKDRNQDIFIDALTDRPEAGANSLYQRVAKTFFLSKAPDKFTFLSNAGPLALLFFSGSLAFVALGMSLLTACLLGTEWLADRWLGNPLFSAVALAALANVLSQMTFPYLSMIFFFELWFALGVFAALQRTGAATAT